MWRFGRCSLLPNYTSRLGRLQAKLLIRDIREGEKERRRERVSCLSFLLFLSHISHGALYNNSSFLFLFSSRFRSLWATCMTVTMTASGAQLLLLALCVYRGSGLQQSSPRVRLSFKGEFIHINSSDSRHCLNSFFVSFTFTFVFSCFVTWTQTHAHTHARIHASGCVSSLYICKEPFSCRMSNSTTLKTKGGYYVCLVSGSALGQNFSPHPHTHTVVRLVSFSLFLMSDMMTREGNTWNLSVRTKWYFRLIMF